ncbi:hypothetical protein AMAG_19202 [Allomyces macrogynus ATCC 38327]|uniref:Uncharacterized protein n=1 Tax=Allomyces macrogynus (strain ATCC 38327) TaxID=578462 RepID=A0A0L0ST94_ALLM3|nr:hypothetical protein AMAG_19202 [Allomyces macrogynus ATCC 38327]|eukprot:KNE65732.1 hypothetical protein AMAG_19202 [Allomyces macrogynus ATCC 38327]
MSPTKPKVAVVAVSKPAATALKPDGKKPAAVTKRSSPSAAKTPAVPPVPPSVLSTPMVSILDDRIMFPPLPTSAGKK